MALPRFEVLFLFLHVAVAVSSGSGEVWPGLLAELQLADPEAELCLLQRAAAKKLGESSQTNSTAKVLPSRRSSLMMLATSAAGNFRFSLSDLFTARALDTPSPNKSDIDSTRSAEHKLMHDVLEHTKKERKRKEQLLKDEKEVEQSAKEGLVRDWLTPREVLAQSVRATVLGVASGISMPIGVILQTMFFSISDEACSSLLAIGAGSLMFAVTISMYGKMLRDHIDMLHKCAAIAGGLFGALFFIYMDHWLEHWLETSSIEGSPEASSAACDSDVQSEPEDSPMLSAIPSNSEFNREMTPDASRLRCDSPPPALVSPPNSPQRRQPGDEDFTVPPMPDPLESAPLKPRRKSTGSVWTGYSQKESLHYTHVQEFFQGKQKRFTMVSIDAAQFIEHPEAKAARKVALTLFLGLLIDGVPEGIFMGFLAAEGKLSQVFVLSLLIANLPEALSSSLLLERANMSFWIILSLWAGLCLFVGLLCGASCAVMLSSYPEYAVGKKLPPVGGFVVALIEGISGGAMLACISAVMLPEALKRSGGKDVPVWRSSGCLCVMGFLLSVGLEVITTTDVEE